MNEVFFTFMGLGLITTIQFIIVINRLDGIEHKINELKKENK